MGIVNDRLEDINAELRLKMVNFDGKVIWEDAYLVDIPANSSNNYFDVNKNEFRFKYRKELANTVFVAEIVENGKVLSKNMFYFEPFKSLKVKAPKVDYTLQKTDDGFDISVITSYSIHYTKLYEASLSVLSEMSKPSSVFCRV